MNLQTQFQMEDIRKKREQANKTKSSAVIMIIIGCVSLLFAGVLVVLSIMSASDPNLRGGDTSLVLDICIGIAILLGLVGILLLTTGLRRRSTGHQELASAEEDNRMLSLQMVAEEEQRKRLNVKIL